MPDNILSEFHPTVYDAVIYSLNQVAKDFLKIIAPIPFMAGGAFYFGNALNHGDSRGMIIGGLVVVVSGAVQYYQFRRVKKHDEELVRGMEANSKQQSSLDSLVIEADYKIIEE